MMNGIQKEKHPAFESSDASYSRADDLSFKEIFDLAGDAMLAKYGSNFAHCYVNQSACEMTGYSFNELMNMGFKDLVHLEELHNIEDRLEKRRNGIECPSCYKTRIVSKNGDIIPVEVSVTLREEEKNKVSFVILKDLRKEKFLEDKKNKRLSTLEKKLVKQESEYKELNRELVQTQQAMSVLVKNLDKKRIEIEQKVNNTINSKVMPIINDLLVEKSVMKFWPEINTMAEYLNSIITKNDLHQKIISMLTETELKVAAMIKNKMTSKEIAKVMYVSLETVKTHRKNIRKKLNIHNTKHGLLEYLASVMRSEDSEQ